MSDVVESMRLVKNEDGSWRSWNERDATGVVECIDVVPAVKDESDRPEVAMDIETRVGLSLGVGRWLRTSERFNEASKEYTSACRDLRKKLKPGQRFVVQVDFKHYIVTADRDGNFDVEPVPSL